MVFIQVRTASYNITTTSSLFPLLTIIVIIIKKEEAGIITWKRDKMRVSVLLWNSIIKYIWVKNKK